MAWFNHHRLLEPIGYIPPAEAEANYYRQLASQAPRWRPDLNQTASTEPGAIESWNHAERSIGCAAYRNALHFSMIIGFRHKGLETLYRTGSARGVQAAHAPKLGRILAALDAAATPAELNQPGYKLHPLKGTLKGHWSVWVNGNWRVTFRFVGQDVELVDYQDYH